jgi:cell division protein FtsI/penicillin-binding protein 2
VGIGGYADGKYVASFVGFSPVEHPKIVIVVVLDEPEKGYYGGIVAAPVFKEIALKTLDYMNISPQKSANQLTVAMRSG